MREEPREGIGRKTTPPDRTNLKVPDRRGGCPSAPSPIGVETITMDDK